jgi:hypothetical protein
MEDMSGRSLSFIGRTMFRTCFGDMEAEAPCVKGCAGTTNSTVQCAACETYKTREPSTLETPVR